MQHRFRRLTRQQNELLAELLQKHFPNEANILLSTSPTEWQIAQLQQLREIAGGEIEFDKDWEPTPRGELVESLIDWITRTAIEIEKRNNEK